MRLLGAKNGFGFVALIALVGGASAGPDQPTKFTNQGTIANTRHNLTQRPPDVGPLGPITAGLMDPSRNDYGEVCVYCHTPHGANAQIALPLWNRTVKTNTYTTYNQLGTSTITQPIGQPGANSISCLTCHDGTTAVDSIINMPGSGRYSAAQETGAGGSEAFLDSWTGNASQQHQTLALGLGGGTCLSCHSPDGVFEQATDFTVFSIGLDLRNDHPVGVRFPTSNTDFNVTNATSSRGDTFFDKDGDARMDKDEVRLYETGDGPEVECASCHDPHGVPSGGTGSVFNPTFLRVSNAGSSLCMTCHVK